MKKQFIVIGLGRFGMSLTKTLIQNKHEVLAVDKELHLVEAISEIATQAVQGDCTDEEVLAELGVDNFNHAIVAVDKSLETSIMVTLLLKEMGMPKVTAKAKNALHGKMLKKIGADQIIHPERDMGIGPFSKKCIFKLGMKEAKVYTFLEPIVMILSIILLSTILGFGSILISQGDLTFGGFLAAFLILFQLFTPIKAFSGIWVSYKSATGASIFIDYIFSYKDKETKK